MYRTKRLGNIRYFYRKNWNSSVATYEIQFSNYGKRVEISTVYLKSVKFQILTETNLETQRKRDIIRFLSHETPRTLAEFMFRYIRQDLKLKVININWRIA